MKRMFVTFVLVVGLFIGANAQEEKEVLQKE